jgi:exosortase
MNIVAKRSMVVLFLAMSLFVASAFPVTVSLIDIWHNDTTFNHGFLILPLFFVACFLKSEIFDVYPIRFEPLTIPALAIAASLMMIVFFGGFNIIAHFLWAVCLILIVIAAFGRHIVSRNIGLVLFLFFTVPFGTEFIIPLQNLTANVSVFLLKLSGVDVVYEGIHIITPRIKFYVAEACAGLRFLIANIFICYIFAYLHFRTKKSWIIFGIVSTLIPIVGNCLRVYSVMMIGYYTNGEYATGVDHIVYGWGFFTVLAFINLMIGDKIAKHEPFIETATAPLLPFGVYDATRDIFSPYRHFYEKRIFLSFIIIILIPAVINHHFNTIFDNFDKNKGVSIPQIATISPIKFDEHITKDSTLITHFKNSDYQKAYALDDTTTLQISYYHYQNTSKEVTSSMNMIHNEENRFLLSQDTIHAHGHDYNLTVTGHIDGQKYVTLSTYFYGADTDLKQTISKIDIQYHSMMNLLYKGQNAGGILLIDKTLQKDETPKQAIDALIHMMQ